MSEKRPETSADIITRSKVVRSGALGENGLNQSRLAKQRGYSVDLTKHMAECDANYHRLLRLFPKLKEQDEREFRLHLPSIDAEVSFTVLERGPFTTHLQIKLHAQAAWMGMVAPDITVRAYHDAKSAEVVSYQHENRFHGKYEYPNQRMRQRDEKAQINRFLSEFLNLCLQHGVSNDPVSF